MKEFYHPPIAISDCTALGKISEALGYESEMSDTKLPALKTTLIIPGFSPYHIRTINYTNLPTLWSKWYAANLISREGTFSNIDQSRGITYAYYSTKHNKTALSLVDAVQQLPPYYVDDCSIAQRSSFTYPCKTIHYEKDYSFTYSY